MRDADAERIGEVYNARMLRIDALKDEVQELRELMTRAHALVHEASNLIDWDPAGWHVRAESFLGDCMEQLQ